MAADAAGAVETLTKSQAARRSRVVAAALELGSAGGYEAVQMRDVATTANVALGTIYRYFSSKDHLLAAALVEWVIDLGRRVTQRPPRGATTAERLVNILRRATRAMEGEPRLSEAVLTALTSTDPGAAQCQREVSTVMGTIMARAFDDDFDPATRDAIILVLGHVWFSCLIGWVNGWLRIGEAGNQLEGAAHLLLDSHVGGGEGRR